MNFDIQKVIHENRIKNLELALGLCSKWGNGDVVTGLYMIQEKLNTRKNWLEYCDLEAVVNTIKNDLFIKNYSQH